MADSKAGVEDIYIDPDHLSMLEIKKVLKVTAAKKYIWWEYMKMTEKNQLQEHLIIKLGTI